MVHGFSIGSAMTDSVSGTTGRFALLTALDRSEIAPTWGFSKHGTQGHRIFQPAARRLPGCDERRGSLPAYGTSESMIQINLGGKQSCRL